MITSRADECQFWESGTVLFAGVLASPIVATGVMLLLAPRWGGRFVRSNLWYVPPWWAEVGMAGCLFLRVVLRWGSGSASGVRAVVVHVSGGGPPVLAANLSKASFAWDEGFLSWDLGLALRGMLRERSVLTSVSPGCFGVPAWRVLRRFDGGPLGFTTKPLGFESKILGVGAEFS
jgi:hypothetical protein